MLDRVDIGLDETNLEFNYALDFATHTDKFVYLTGKAGTGKTTFLKQLKNVTTKNTVVLAPTGVAAINAGGQTIHSFFQIKPSMYVPGDSRLKTEGADNIYDNFKYSKIRLNVIKKLELLIIDEISMVRCDLLDVIDRLLRVFRSRENEVFGGVQVIIIGDTFQLPPIVDNQESKVLSEFYESPFFFSSNVIQSHKPVYIELKKVYRQSEQDFIDLLNKIRINDINEHELRLLNSRYNPSFVPETSVNYVMLATHNDLVNSTNLSRLSGLVGEVRSFEAEITGVFPDKIMPVDKTLRLKEGAQIMFVKNDKAKRYYNGKIAKISRIENSKIIVEFDNGEEINVEKQDWNNVRYSWNEKEGKIEEDIIGSFSQYPLKLAWAITVHKSQGLTFDNVIADLSSAFAAGQVYVALSRCTTFSGLILKSKIGRDAIITDRSVLQFSEYEMSNSAIRQELDLGKKKFSEKKSKTDMIKELFEFGNKDDKKTDLQKTL